MQLALERHRPEEAIDALRDGIERLTTHQRTWWEEHDPAESPNPALVEQLRIFEQEIRKKFAVEKTLREQLDEAVAREDYEQAARLRDQIQAQKRARRRYVRGRRVRRPQSESPSRGSMSQPRPVDEHRRRRPVPRRRRGGGRSSRRPGGSARRN